MSDEGVGRFVGRRLLGAVPILIVITFAVFALIHLAPGTPERALLGTRPTSPETLAAIRERWNLDEPFLVQYLLWLKAVVVGDLGRSIQTNQDVTTVIGQRIGLTIYLGLYSLLIALVVGIPLGMWAAIRRGSKTDRAVVGVR